ncbi:MAG: hypothetical protein ACRBFS_07195 [Aureispira sp.]
MFKKGDYITIKDHSDPETGTLVNNWAGEIEEVFMDDQRCAIVLDAPTIHSLDDDFIIGALEEGAEPFMCVLSWNKLDKASRRDTDDDMMEALERLSDRAIVLEEQIEKERAARREACLDEFEQSSFYKELEKIQQEQAVFLARTFVDIMYQFQYQRIHQWEGLEVQEACLELIPQTVTADEAAFEMYGTILLAFFRFLGDQGYLENMEELIKVVDKIQDHIPIEAQKSQNWNNSKTLMMEAIAEGIDINDQKALELYILEKQRLLHKKPPPSSISFNGIGRNEKITVQYEDGSIVKAIKFKKVKADLESGRCTLLKK